MGVIKKIRDAFGGGDTAESVDTSAFTEHMRVLEGELASRRSEVNVVELAESVVGVVKAQEESDRRQLIRTAEELNTKLAAEEKILSEMVDSLHQLLSTAKEKLISWLIGQLSQRRVETNEVRDRLRQIEERIRLVQIGVMGLPGMAIPTQNPAATWVFMMIFMIVMGTIDYLLGMDIFRFASSTLTAVGITAVVAIVTPIVTHIAASSQRVFSSYYTAIGLAEAKKKSDPEYVPILFPPSSTTQFLRIASHALLLSFVLGLLGFRISVALGSDGHFSSTDMLGTCALVFATLAFYLVDLKFLNAFVNEAKEVPELEAEKEALEKVLEQLDNPAMDEDLVGLTQEFQATLLGEYWELRAKFEDKQRGVISEIEQHSRLIDNANDHSVYTDVVIVLVNRIIKSAQDKGYSVMPLINEGGSQGMAIRFENARHREEIPFIRDVRFGTPQPDGVGEIIDNAWHNERRAA